MYVERELAGRFGAIFEVCNMVALVGPRQAGKTTLLKEQMRQYCASDVLFDDPDARSMFEGDVKKLESHVWSEGGAESGEPDDSIGGRRAHRE